MFQTKYFDTSNVAGPKIDEKINRWLKANNGIELVDVKYTCDPSGFTTVLLIYFIEDKENEIEGKDY